MPTALVFNGNTIKGVTLEGMEIQPRKLQFHDRKFWGVSGISRIFGQAGDREILIPLLIYDPATFTTANILSTYIDTTINGTLAGTHGTLTVTSESDHPAFTDVSFEGALIVDGPKKDEGGTLGGGYWVMVLAHFTQLS